MEEVAKGTLCLIGLAMRWICAGLLTITFVTVAAPSVGSWGGRTFAEAFVFVTFEGAGCLLLFPLSSSLLHIERLWAICLFVHAVPRRHSCSLLPLFVLLPPIYAFSEEWATDLWADGVVTGLWLPFNSFVLSMLLAAFDVKLRAVGASAKENMRCRTSCVHSA